jgi:hypothetical protein
MSRWIAWLGGLAGALLGGCSETGFAQPVGVEVGLDATEPATTGGDEPPTLGSPGEPCTEPEAGYAKDPAARLLVADDTLPITFTWLGSHAGYEQALVVDAPEASFVADSDDLPGRRVVVGPFPVGTELVLGHDVYDTGDHWRSGPASRNADGEIHGAAAWRGGCSWWFGFEDTDGGGDADYDDLLVRVDGPLVQAP